MPESGSIIALVVGLIFAGALVGGVIVAIVVGFAHLLGVA